MTAGVPEITWTNERGQWGGEFGGARRAPLRKLEDGSQIIYMYLDESGTFNFKGGDGDVFLMTCAVMKRRFRCAESLLHYKYDCLDEGLELERFHASDDSPFVRVNVFERIVALARDCSAYVIAAKKSELPEEMKNPGVLYSKMFEWIVRKVRENEVDESVCKAIVITDSIPQQAKKAMVEKPLKSFMKREFQENGTPYVLLHHHSGSDHNLQIADYLSWAAQRYIVSGHDWPYRKVQHLFKMIGWVRASETTGGDD